MSLSQSLPITHTATSTEATARARAWRSMSDLFSRALHLSRSRVRTATDHTLLSAHMLRDIGLVRDEPPYAGVWDHCRMDYRL